MKIPVSDEQVTNYYIAREFFLGVHTILFGKNHLMGEWKPRVHDAVGVHRGVWVIRGPHVSFNLYPFDPRVGVALIKKKQ